MSASSAAPVSSDETSAETAVEPVGELTMEVVGEILSRAWCRRARP